MPWNGSGVSGSRTTIGDKCRKTPCRFNTIKIALIVLSAVVACMIVFILSTGKDIGDNPTIEKKPPRKIKTVDVKKSKSPRKVKTEEKKALTWKDELREKLKGLSPEERFDVAFKMMQERKIDLTPTTNTPFRTGIELSMARIFMTRVGFPPPPIHTTFLPIQDEAHLAEILIAGNPVIEGDSEEIKEAKATVELVKKEMIAYIKDGGHPEDFMAHYYNKLQTAFQERRDSLKEIARVAIEEPEIAQEFYNTINKRLESKGITPIELTEKQKQRLGLE